MFSHSSRRLKLERLEDRVVPALVIVPTFAANIQSDPNAAAIESTFNQAIGIYEGYIADSITVNITYQEMTSGLGENFTFLVPETYSSYLSALEAHATSAADVTALANLPAGPDNPVNDGTMIDIRAPLARALGYSDASNANIPMDSTISLNTSICNLSRPGANPDDFDLLAVVLHEMDEALGGGSALDGLAQNASGPATIEPLDLFRYVSPGVRSYNTDAPTGAPNQAYFSIDGGVTDLANFNQEATGDFGDWYSFPNGAPTPPGPEVQDAFQTPGSAPNLGVELTRLDVLGFTLTTTPTVAFTSTPNIIIANKSNVSASGTGVNGDTISVTITDGTNTTTAATTTVSDGSWSVSGIDASSLNDGKVTYAVTETDFSGNASEVTQTATKLTVAPAVAFTSTPNISIANKASVSAAGTGDDGDMISVTITVGTSTTTAATTTVSGGSWSVSDINPSSLSDGTVTYSVTETAALGNTTTITQTVTKLTVAPVIAFTSTPSINIANSGNITVAGTGGNGDTISLTITDGTNTTSPATTTVSNGTWSVGNFDTSSLADGQVTYVATEMDAVGNTTTIRQSASKFTVAPEVTITSSLNINLANESNVTVAGTGGNGDTILLTITDDTTTTAAASTTVSDGVWSVGNINASSLADGTVTYSVTETDTVGNITMIKQSTTKVSTAPGVPMVTPSTVKLAANAGTLIIQGFGFSSVAANNKVTFSGGATGKVTHATPTQLTVTNLGGLVAGSLSATVTVGKVSSVSEPVAIVVPIVTANRANLAVNATTLIIRGLGFSSTTAHNTVTFSNGATGKVTKATATTLTVTGLSGAPAGSLAVIVTSNGVSSNAAVQVATVPITARKVSAGNVSQTQITLTWNAIAGATSYEVEQRQANGTWSLLFTLGSGTTSQLITVEPGSTNTFRVGATDAEATAWSSPVKVTSFTLAPIVTAKTGVATQITLAWNALAGTSVYLIKEKLSNGTYTTLYTVGGGTTQITFIEPAGGTNDFLVEAIGGHGNPKVTAHTTNVTQITLSWTAVAGATKYEVDEQLADGTWEKLATVGSSTTHYTVTPQPADTNIFRVGAIDAEGTEFSIAVGGTT